MRIVRLYDDCGHDLGYYDLSTENGYVCFCNSLVASLDSWQELDTKINVIDLLDKYSNENVNVQGIKDLLDNEESMTYIEEIEITR